MDDKNTTERSLPFEEGGYTFVLRETMADEINDKTGKLVDEDVTRHWNEGLIRGWIESPYNPVFALKDELPEKVESVYFKCDPDGESREKIRDFEAKNKGSHGNWGVICQGEEELVAFADIDFYACKYWDWCEESVYEEYEKNKIIIVDHVEDLEDYLYRVFGD